MSKQTIILTLFEKQIIRNIIVNNKGQLIKNLATEYDLIIFTNTELFSILNDLFTKLELPDVTIQSVRALKSNFLYKFLSVFAKNMNSSSSNKWSRNRNFSLKSFTIFGLFIRNSINLIFAKHKFFHRILRCMMKYLVSSRELGISKIINKSELIILTSVTNFIWDVPIGQIASRKKKKIIAIPRSWDNFTSHGALRIKPNIIFSFSPEMTKYLINYHFISKKLIFEVKNPAYDNKDNKQNNEIFKSSSERKLLYACMGTYLYEQEITFIEILNKKAKDFGFELEILKHPKFLTDTPKGINTNVIPYDEFSSLDLLQKYLSEYRIVITAGSSIALDCFNYGIEFFCVFIEDSKIDYWRSIKRYIDTVEHFADFLTLHNVNIVYDIEHLSTELEKLSANMFKENRIHEYIKIQTPSLTDAVLSTIHHIIRP